MQTLLYNGRLVLPDRLIEDGWLLIEEDRIAGLGEASTRPGMGGLSAIDLVGTFMMPGLIDLHCDGIEKLTEPRPNVSFDLPTALAEDDRRLATCGVTTEFHAITLDDHEFGTRSTTYIHELDQAIKGNLPDSLIRHEIHARLEITSARGLEQIQQLIADRSVRLVSLNDHSPGQGQFKDEQFYRNYIKQTVYQSDAEIDAFVALKAGQRAHKPARIELVARLVREAGLALATHDDDDVEQVTQWPAKGVTIAEFPTTMPAARAAHELGLGVCLGAPNVVRGKSSGGNLSANSAIEAGICDVLCADYYPASMLLAVFKLATNETLSLPGATRLVTLNPAKAVGLGDNFGSLEVGKTADLIAVSLNQANRPRVRRIFVGGQEKLVLN